MLWETRKQGAFRQKGGGVDGFQFECTEIVFCVFLVDASIHNKNNCRHPRPPPRQSAFFWTLHSV